MAAAVQNTSCWVVVLLTADRGVGEGGRGCRVPRVMIVTHMNAVSY